jgi:hypothetical protein
VEHCGIEIFLKASDTTILAPPHDDTDIQLDRRPSFLWQADQVLVGKPLG